WEHPESYHSVIARTVTEPLGVDPSQVHVPEAPDDATEGPIDYYDEKITAAGGIDLQLLGIGRNGHIGFNEPGTPFDSPTHIAQLTELTREDNSRFFEGGIDEVPQLPSHRASVLSCNLVRPSSWPLVKPKLTPS